MTSDPQVHVPELHASLARRTVLAYLAAGGAWVLLSAPLADELAAAVPWSREGLELAKGLGFVGVTAAVLYVVLRRWARSAADARTIERAADERLRETDTFRALTLAAAWPEFEPPLRRIISSGQTLRDEAGQLAAPAAGLLAGNLLADAEYLEQLCHGLVTSDELIRGVVSLDAEPTELSGLVRRVVDATPSGSSQVTVTGEPVTVRVDVVRFERAVRHLLESALYHDTGRGAVTLEVGVEDGEASLRVRGGVPAPRDVTPDATAGPAATEPPLPACAELGLGVYVAVQLVQLHAGSLTVTNREDPDAAYAVRLPLEDKPLPAG